MVLIVLQLYDDAGDVILADRCVMGVVVSSNDHVVAFTRYVYASQKGNVRISDRLVLDDVGVNVHCVEPCVDIALMRSVHDDVCGKIGFFMIV